MFKKISIIILILTSISGCKINDSIKKYGIVNLKVKSEKLFIGKSNKNDVIIELGDTILKEFPDFNSWIYSETEQKTGYLGKKVLIKNNILLLEFDNKGVLVEKKFLDKNDMNEVLFDEITTETYAINDSTSKKFFSSMRKRLQAKQRSLSSN